MTVFTGLLWLIITLFSIIWLIASILVSIFKKPFKKKFWVIYFSLFVSSIISFAVYQSTWCEHEFVETSNISPTCTNEGEISDTCIVCNYERNTTVEPLGHELIIVETIEPTYTQTEVTTYKCTVCGVLIDEISDKLIAENSESTIEMQEDTSSAESKEESSSQNDEADTENGEFDSKETNQDTFGISDISKYIDELLDKLMEGNSEDTIETQEDVVITESVEQPPLQSDNIDTDVAVIIDTTEYVIGNTPLNTSQLISLIGDPEYIDEWVWTNTKGVKFDIVTYGYNEFEYNFHNDTLTRISNPFGPDIQYKFEDDFLAMFNISQPVGNEFINEFGVYEAYRCDNIEQVRFVFDEDEKVITDVMITFVDIYN